MEQPSSVNALCLPQKVMEQLKFMDYFTAEECASISGQLHKQHPIDLIADTVHSNGDFTSSSTRLALTSPSCSAVLMVLL